MPQVVKEIIVKNPQGLHARPAAMFVQIASRYNSNVTIRKDDEKVNGKSIMGILTLGVQPDTKIILEVEGEDADEVLGELEKLLTRDIIE
jgi:phosphocarrier protein HPr